MSNANGRRILEEAKAMEHGEVACGLAIAAEALSIELKRVKQQRAELLEALKAARDRLEASAEIIDDVKGECRSVAELYEDLAMPNELYIVLNAINRAEAAE